MAGASGVRERRRRRSGPRSTTPTTTSSARRPSSGPRSAKAVVRADATELLEMGKPAQRLDVPAELLCAERGMVDDPEPAPAAGARAAVGRRRAAVAADGARPGVNHYTVVMGAAGARRSRKQSCAHCKVRPAIVAYDPPDERPGARVGAGPPGARTRSRPDQGGDDRPRGRAAAAARRRPGRDRAAHLLLAGDARGVPRRGLLPPVRPATIRRLRVRRPDLRPGRAGDRARVRVDRVVPRAGHEPCADGRLVVAAGGSGRDLRRRRLPLRVGGGAGR